MNNARRKELAVVAGGLSDLLSDLEWLCGEERDYFDNMPESFQNSSKGEAVQEVIDSLEAAAASLEEAVDYINGAT